MRARLLLTVSILAVVLAVYMTVSRSDNEQVLGNSSEAESGELTSGQKYILFDENDFEVKYPDWPSIDPNGLTPDIDGVKVAVGSGECSFILRQDTTPDVPPSTYVDGVINGYGVRGVLNKKKVEDNTVYLEMEVKDKDITQKVSSYYVKTSGNFYDFHFVSEKDKFESSCRPLVAEVIGSVKVK